MPIKEKNYWLETVTVPPAPSAGDLPDHVDVAIVGAGYCGLSAARTLAKRGVNVAVLEAETFGWGASSRNGGMALTGMKLTVPTLIRFARHHRLCRADRARRKDRVQLLALRPPRSGVQAITFRRLPSIRRARQARIQPRTPHHPKK
ncbi:MAG: hypothetical protein DMG49_22425 [Acidobacteria bacterium]|nr:MAG: hypothetical protein DMG49_22425 [Acidobacteriota bacterium]